MFFRMGNSPIDASVGALVWVRRRNGSWWPGRILGLDELPESSLVSPRSGTPVKLLGREDASIDWYNLEKSKRVKAFRCGEYDVCIEKAKASAANSSKKTIKYARRDDAILHALQLERARVKSARKSPPLSYSSEEEKHQMNHHPDDSSESAREISRSGLSFEAPNFISSFKLQSEQGRRRRTPNDSEDDGSEGVKRMKGLVDLGMAVMSRAEDKERNLVEPCQQQHVCKVYSSSYKRKRSQVPNVHEFLKKRNRRRPLTKLLESTAMVAAPVVYDEIGSPRPRLSDGMITGDEFSETKNNDQSVRIRVAGEDGVSLNAFEASNSSLKLAENNSFERLSDSQFAEEGRHPAGKKSSQNNQAETECLGIETPNDESGWTSSVAAHAHGASEWQSKGKRNSRHTNKDKTKADQKIPSNFSGESQKEHQRLLQPLLYSVKVEMKTSHRPHDVPIVSLMSKSNGKAIIGHPLTIEILGDGFCDQRLNRAKSNLEGHENGRGARPSSRTRRRTVNRFKLLPGISCRKSSSITKKAAQLSKKIRKLSSLTGRDQFKNAMAPVVEKPEGAVIACIPLRVVFSRINEALTGLLRSAHRPVISSTNQ